MLLDLWFLFGVVIYAVLFAAVYFYMRKSSPKRTARSSEDRDKILRWTIASLIFSIFLLVIKPIWFPTGESVMYDIYDILLLITAIASMVATFIIIRRNR